MPLMPSGGLPAAKSGSDAAAAPPPTSGMPSGGLPAAKSGSDAAAAPPPASGSPPVRCRNRSCAANPPLPSACCGCISIRQHTSAYVFCSCAANPPLPSACCGCFSIRQHTSAYVVCSCAANPPLPSACCGCVSIRQHTSAYVFCSCAANPPLLSACCGCVSIRQHTSSVPALRTRRFPARAADASAYVSIRLLFLRCEPAASQRVLQMRQRIREHTSAYALRSGNVAAHIALRPRRFRAYT
jgi:hypothetical protein